MKNLSGKRILVTGAAGFIGAKLTSRLLEEKAEIHAVSRAVQGSPSGGIHWHTLDLTEFLLVDDLVRETCPHIIYHLAGMVTGSQNLDVVVPMFHDTLHTTVNLLTAASKNGCSRFIMAGSMMEETGDKGFPISPYAAAKKAGSCYLKMFKHLYGLPTINARIFMTYGPGQRDLTKIIPYVIISLLRGETPHLSSGSRLVDWIFIDDIAEGLLVLADCMGIEGSTIDLGSGHLVSIREVTERITNLVDSKENPLFGALEERLFEPALAASRDETLKRTGWEPRVSLDAGLEITVRWYRDQLFRGALVT